MPGRSDRMKQRLTVTRSSWQTDPRVQFESASFSLVPGNSRVNQNEIKLAVFPNPTRGLLIIETEEIIKNISIINTLGNELILVENNNTSLNPTKLDLATFAKGIYFIRIELSSQIINYRIVLQ